MTMKATRKRDGMREAAMRARALLVGQEKMREIRGDTPRLNAGELPPLGLEAAKTSWPDGHYRQAVTQAAIRVNAQTQRRTGVRERGEHDLIVHLLKTDAPKPGPATRAKENWPRARQGSG